MLSTNACTAKLHRGLSKLQQDCPEFQAPFPLPAFPVRQRPSLVEFTHRLQGSRQLPTDMSNICVLWPLDGLQGLQGCCVLAGCVGVVALRLHDVSEVDACRRNVQAVLPQLAFQDGQGTLVEFLGFFKLLPLLSAVHQTPVTCGS